MARGKNVLFTPSLMERLSERQEGSQRHRHSITQIKEAIRRDLETLLNTRKSLSIPQYQDAQNTVVEYGLEDLSDIRADRQGYLWEMQEAIRRCLTAFEPRLTNVVVSAHSTETQRQEIRLSIEATLLVHPRTEMVSFHTVFNLASETYSVA